MSAFQYHPEIVARFPGVVGGVIVAGGLVNGPAPPALAAAYRDEQAAVRARLGERSLADLPSLAAWRRAFSAFGVAPTQYRSAAEALLRRLTKQGEIPAINALVDLGNLVSIRHALPVAIFDARGADGGITVRFAAGDERFTPLGADAPERPEPGEVIFADPSGRVQARRWCWRQSAESAARADTGAAIVTVEAHHAGGRADVEAALADLLSLLREHAGGQAREAVLDAGRPSL